jgi:hypothetical protein
VKKLELSDVGDLVSYEKIREEFRARIIELKRPRRIQVGDQLTFVFEHRDTVLFQVQEMMRAERIVVEEEILAELAIYNELIPPEHGLAATLMIEITKQESIRSELDRLIGIDEHVSLEIGGEVVRATFDPKQFEEDRISAVQYIRFPLGRKLAERFADPSTPATLCVDHPNYRGRTSIEGASRASLAADLAA